MCVCILFYCSCFCFEGGLQSRFRRKVNVSLQLGISRGRGSARMGGGQSSEVGLDPGLEGGQGGCRHHLLRQAVSFDGGA